MCTAAVCIYLSSLRGQNTEKWTASIKSILSGSPREQLVACGVLATSSYYCSVSKTAALSLLLQPAILFYSLKHGSLNFLCLSPSILCHSCHHLSCQSSCYPPSPSLLSWDVVEWQSHLVFTCCFICRVKIKLLF